MAICAKTWSFITKSGYFARIIMNASPDFRFAPWQSFCAGMDTVVICHLRALLLIVTMSAKDANCILLREVRPTMKYLNLYVIVLEVGRPKKTKDGHEVRTVKIADKSGSMNLSVWDELGQHVHPSDILRIRNAYCGTWKGSMTIYTGKGGTIGKVGEFTMLFSELPNFSEPKPELLNQTASNATFEEDNRSSPSSPAPASGQSTSRGEGNSRLGTRQPYSRPNRR